MLIASFELIEVATSSILFRGRDSFFWKRKIFKDIPFYDPDSRDKDKERENDFDYLIVFEPFQFLVMEPAGIDEIIEDLSHRDPGKDNIISIEGKPFFAISRGSFQKLRLNLREDREITSKLRNNGNVRVIAIKHPFYTLDMKYESEAIEKSITAYQTNVLAANGVTVEDLGNFYIEGMIPIGEGSRLSSGVVIKGDTRIGKNVHIYPHAYIENSVIGDNCTVLPGCVVCDSLLEENVKIGPYTHLRNGSIVRKNAKMGNFVEMKKSVLGEGSKSMHLTYIGDADIGENVNIGAGTITCNFDGVNKNKTVIESGVFIGSGTELVAPVTLRKNSYVGAGSTITEEVPEEALAIARQKQKNIPGWVARKKKRNFEPHI
jgi:NDP-sugar pyrophosphorylase family protein